MPKTSPSPSPSPYASPLRLGPLSPSHAPRAPHALPLPLRLGLPLLLLALSAHAVPQEWSLEVSSTRPYQFTAYHGETLELAASFTHNGAPWQLSGDYALFWQTNGMSGYWTAPASVVSNRVSATFTGAMDPGAPIVYGFLGSTGSNYRAAFSCRFQSSPGAAPNALPLPVPILDFAQVRVLNPPYYTKAEVNSISNSLAEAIAEIDASAIEAIRGQVETNAADIATLNTNLAAATTAATNYTDSATNSTTQALMAELGSATNAITSNLSANYYTAAETDDAIDSLAAYYITSNAAGDAFPTYAALTNATVYYSGGDPRTPTRNDYAVVLADETHGGGEWRYIFAVHSPGDPGQWEAQYPIETNDYEALANKPSINGHVLTSNQTAAKLGLATSTEVNGARLDAELAREMAFIANDNAYVAAVTATNYTDSATNSTTQALMAELGSAISAANPTFSNAVLAVGLNLDSDAVAAINALVDQADEIPISGATTVGALLLALAAAVAALKKDLRYSFNAATVQDSGAGVLMATGLADRATNYFTVPDGFGFSACNVTLPAATPGKMRDFYIRINLEETNTVSFTWEDPATNTDAVIEFGEDSLADIDTGYNLILFTEIDQTVVSGAVTAAKWIVSVKHEEAS